MKSLDGEGSLVIYVTVRRPSEISINNVPSTESRSQKPSMG